MQVHDRQLAKFTPRFGRVIRQQQHDAGDVVPCGDPKCTEALRLGDRGEGPSVNKQFLGARRLS
jgi:hypothetical protein